MELSNTTLNPFVLVGLVQLAAVMSPGPDFAMVTKNALNYSRKHALMTTIGITLGVTIHISLCIFGIATIIANTPALFKIVKLAGGSYLGYLGYKSFTAKSSAKDNVAINDIKCSPGQALLQGFYCNILNVKAIVFFLTFFGFLMSNSNFTFANQWLFNVEMTIITLTWFGILSLIISAEKIKSQLHKIQHWINKIFGVILMGFAANIILQIFN